MRIQTITFGTTVAKIIVIQNIVFHIDVFQKTVKSCEKQKPFQVKTLLDFHERIINFMEASCIPSTDTGFAC